MIDSYNNLPLGSKIESEKYNQEAHKINHKERASSLKNYSNKSILMKNFKTINLLNTKSNSCILTHKIDKIKNQIKKIDSGGPDENTGRDSLLKYIYTNNDKKKIVSKIIKEKVEDQSVKQLLKSQNISINNINFNTALNENNKKTEIKPENITISWNKYIENPNKNTHECYFLNNTKTKLLKKPTLIDKFKNTYLNSIKLSKMNINKMIQQSKQNIENDQLPCTEKEEDFKEKVYKNDYKKKKNNIDLDNNEKSILEQRVPVLKKIFNENSKPISNQKFQNLIKTNFDKNLNGKEKLFSKKDYSNASLEQSKIVKEEQPNSSVNSSKNSTRLIKLPEPMPPLTNYSSGHNQFKNSVVDYVDFQSNEGKMSRERPGQTKMIDLKNHSLNKKSFNKLGSRVYNFDPIKSRNGIFEITEQKQDSQKHLKKIFEKLKPLNSTNQYSFFDKKGDESTKFIRKFSKKSVRESQNQFTSSSTCNLLNGQQRKTFYNNESPYETIDKKFHEDRLKQTNFLRTSVTNANITNNLTSDNLPCYSQEYIYQKKYDLFENSLINEKNPNQPNPIFFNQQWIDYKKGINEEKNDKPLKPSDTLTSWKIINDQEANFSIDDILECKT